MSFAAQETVLAEKKAAQNREDEQLKIQENEIREIKKKLDELRQQMNEMEIQCREVALNSENLKKAIAEKHNVDLESMVSGFQKLRMKNLPNSVPCWKKINKQ